MNELKIHIEKHGVAVVTEIDGAPMEMASTMGTVFGRAVAEMAKQYNLPYDELLNVMMGIFSTAVRRSMNDSVSIDLGAINLGDLFKK